MPVRVPLEFVKPTMQLAAAIVDGEGRLLAGKGTTLGDRVVRALRKQAMQTVLIEDTDDLQPWETVRSLDIDRRELDARFRTGVDGPETPELAMLHQAVARHLERRWARRASDPGVAVTHPAGGSA
jgi:hypothetical protein